MQVYKPVLRFLLGAMSLATDRRDVGRPLRVPPDGLQDALTAR